MSARILSMGFTTLRFTRAGHEIACRYFLTHLMNIGSPTLRFRDAATRRQAIPRNGSYAIGTPCTRSRRQTNFARSGSFTPSPTFILRESVMLDGDL
jgi:hypothetical protein